MAREYPRFLLSSPKGGKHKGPFVFHALPPVMLCKIVLDSDDKPTLKFHDRSLGKWTIRFLKSYDNCLMSEIDDAMDEILEWLPSQY